MVQSEPDWQITESVVAVLVLKHRINKQALETSASTTAFDLRNLR